ncbi:RDD family protein [Myroides injenensis]|uniref:RDD family protein n=1 Tax=Myroides injenensis TaxID=1183151 RepID=UPI0002882912|nr:RDD family protein [Myroides injenensis]
MNKVTSKDFKPSLWVLRLVAYIIDFVFAMLLYFLITYLFIVFSRSSFVDFLLESTWSVLFSILIINFILLFKDCINGISLGKMIMGLQIVNTDTGNTPSFKKLIYRNIYLLIWPIEFAFWLVNNDKRRLADVHLKTTVKVRKVLVNYKLQFLLFFALIIIGIVGVIQWNKNALSHSRPYRAALSQLYINKTIFKEVGMIKKSRMIKGTIFSMGGSKEAKFRIKLIGENKEKVINVQLIKLNNTDWEIANITMSN